MFILCCVDQSACAAARRLQQKMTQLDSLFKVLGDFCCGLLCAAQGTVLYANIVNPNPVPR